MHQRQAWSGLTLALAILGCQLVLILAVSSVWVFLKGVPAGYSSLYGGGIYLAPQLLFSFLTLNRNLCSGNAGWVLWDFYVGSGIKLVSTVILFVTVLTYVELDHLPLYVTYMLSLCFQWVITILLNNRY